MAVEFGRYKLLRKLGSGGMGQVFLARAARPEGGEELVVIKRLLPHLAEDAAFLQTFFDEAHIAAGLAHPNVVRIFDVGKVAGSPYLAMEYVAGEDLRRLERFSRAKEMPVPLGACCRIIADAAAGLEAAHRARDRNGQPLDLIHRDVSPQNILVGFDGAVKLIDFGAAEAAGAPRGKHAYMSPEQTRGEPLGPSSDLFSLGVVFWELLTGKRLFKGSTDQETVQRVTACQVPPPSTVNSSVPARFDAVVLRALQRDPASRYPHADAFRLAIEDLATQLSLPARREDLAAYLSQLYAERLAGEAAATARDELHGSLELDDIPSGPQSGPHTSGAPLLSAGSERWRLLLAAGLGLGIAALVGLVRHCHAS